MSKGFYYAPPSPFPLSSHETALSIIPPQPQCVEINRLRILHDKAWGRWPPHINLIYPFVYPESLPEAKAKIEAKLESVNLPSNQVVLNRVGTFSHRTNHTIFLAEAGDQFDNASPLHIIRSVTLEALGHSASSCNFHLTVGQSVDKSESAKEFLIREADLLPQFEVPIFKLVVLIRERTLPDVRTLGVMRLYCTFDIPGNLEASQPAPMLEFWLPEHHPEETQLHSSPGNGSPRVGFHESSRGDWSDRTIRPGTVYQYSAQRNCWAPKREHMTPIPAGAPLRVSSYNVSTSAKSGSVTSRYSLLVQTILSQSASSDIVVLQEVSNTFLTHLLSEPQILRLYPFVSQGSQDAMEPDNFAIPQNVTLLSKYAFALEPTPVEHHGTVIASFYVRRDSSAPLERLIVAGIDLAYDASMAEKKTMLEMLVEFLSQNYPKDIWIIAGSFDIETSHVSISTEAKDSSIHNDTATTVASIDKILAKAGLVDAWLVSRLEAGDDNVSIIEEIHEGEDGATFDPIENPVAAAKFGKSVNRPQRYDKILLHHQNRLRATHFNQFGLPVIQEGGQVVPSSHYGIRSTLRILTESGDGDELAMLTKRTLHVRRVSTPLADSSVLKSTLRSHIMIPTPEERQLRKDAYALLRDVILGTSERKNPNLSYAPLEFVSLGSYALETWTSASDINCLCVGSISSETFFGLARQRIRRAESRGVRLLRTVEGSSRTSVDLFVNGFRADMQYCAAARVVERWSDIPSLPPSDPIFTLAISSLRRLKPYQDLLYIQRSLPSQATFRLAFRSIKLWAIQRGLYSAKFGFLNGTLITLMLTWICKRLAYDMTFSSVGDAVSTFFHYYANFDWENDIVFDAFYYKNLPHNKRWSYQRSKQEPMVLLGYHMPRINHAHTTSVPSLKVLVKEFKKADLTLADPSMTWGKFFNSSGDSRTGVTEFLSSYESYVRVSIHYWGRSLPKGRGLVDWVKSKCKSLVNEIYRALPGIQVRIWPERFTNDGSSGIESGYQGYYLIGMSRDNISDAYTTKDGRLHAKEALEKVTSQFLDRLHSDENQYDAATTWIDVSIVKSREVNRLRIDNAEWGDYIPEIEPDSDDEDEHDWDNPSSHKLPLRSVHHAGAPISGGDAAKSKLRPAVDVLSRLRWDPDMSPSDYIVGYEDRFSGAKEISLERWKSESTDDEFVPLHRILYFKKRVDNEIVWDRRTRVDKVFGSGCGGGE